MRKHLFIYLIISMMIVPVSTEALTLIPPSAPELAMPTAGSDPHSRTHFDIFCRQCIL